MTNQKNITCVLAGCSFTDPLWQTEIPWSIEYSKYHESFIIAKAGMGIKGICSETLHHLKKLNNIKKLILILPNLWRYDFEVDEEHYEADAIVDLLISKNGKYNVLSIGKRKWLISGGVNNLENKNKIFSYFYKTQGFKVIARDHLSELKKLIDYCKNQNIKIIISCIVDLKEEIKGLEYIQYDVFSMLEEVDYGNWLRFGNGFIDNFLKHKKHPTTDEHVKICEYILNYEKQQR